MLTEYKGPSNRREVFRHLVGERIAAAFEDEKGHVMLALESGAAIVFGAPGGGPTYWTATKEEVERIVAARRGVIERQLAELRDMAGVPLP